MKQLLSSAIDTPHLSYVTVFEVQSQKLLRVSYIYLPSPSLEASITSKIPWYISLLPEVSVLICPPPHNQTPFHTWVNLESHLEREPREPVQ